MFDSNSEQSKCSSSSTDICSWRPDPSLSSESARNWKHASDQQQQKPLSLDCDGTYTVAYGDCLSTIAARALKAQHDTSITGHQIQDEVQAIVKANDGRYKTLDCNNDYVQVGWKLKIPGAPQDTNCQQQPPAETPAPPAQPPCPEQAPPPAPDCNCQQPAPPQDLYPPEMCRPGQMQPPAFMPQAPLTINVNVYDVGGGCGHGGGCCCCCGGYNTAPPYYAPQPPVPPYMQQPACPPQWYPPVPPPVSYMPPPGYQIPIQPPGYVWERPPEPGYAPRPYQQLPGRAGWNQVAPEYTGY